MCLQDKRWSCAGVGCADRFGIRKSPCHLRPTCLESLLGGDPASGPWSWSQAGMMSSMPAPREMKGVGVLVARKLGQLHEFGREKKSRLMCIPQ